MTTTTRSSRVATLQSTFSFYLPASAGREQIEACALLGDALTLSGQNGPRVALEAFGASHTYPLLFDGTGYNPKTPSMSPGAWMEAQANAGADRILTPGAWIPWDGGEDALQTVSAAEVASAQAWPDATVLLAIDIRWLAREPWRVIRRLRDLDRPVALVLGNAGDPFGVAGALEGLLLLVNQVPHTTLLRIDHGGLGAVAFGASHASIGLTPGTRHFVFPGTGGGGKHNDRSPRIFVWDLLDWFTAATIAGWGASSVDLVCGNGGCCHGQSLDRLFDPAYAAEAEAHNRSVLTDLANYILDHADVPQHDELDRRSAFARECKRALGHYGPMGKFSDVIKPKAQLTHWAQFCGS